MKTETIDARQIKLTSNKGNTHLAELALCARFSSPNEMWMALNSHFPARRNTETVTTFEEFNDVINKMLVIGQSGMREQQQRVADLRRDMHAEKAAFSHPSVRAIIARHSEIMESPTLLRRALASAIKAKARAKAAAKLTKAVEKAASKLAYAPKAPLKGIGNARVAIRLTSDANRAVFNAAWSKGHAAHVAINKHGLKISVISPEAAKAFKALIK